MTTPVRIDSRWLSIALLAICTSACPGSGEPVDVGTDARGSAQDGRDFTADSGVPAIDAAAPGTDAFESPGPDATVDTGVPDASVPDASIPDASIPDASIPDATFSPDAFVPPDANAPPDAHTSPDAGSISPQKRGIAVIADFADRRLEDYTGDGVTSVAELRTQLTSMEDHWHWLSRGMETFEWDIERVQLTQAWGPAAFGDWGAFRDEVIHRLKQQIDPDEYDVDHDGDIDAVFIIASSGDDYYDFIMGGASSNNGASVFVDGQGSLSLQSHATGNFNHELGHCRGLPDLYGTYSTVSYLSLMDSSWDLPPIDFGAYERLHLGWVVPQDVTATTRKLTLSPSKSGTVAIKVPTKTTGEYFLLEYRKRPASGYGASGPAYDGIVVFHVFEGSNQNVNPPLLKVEPADGTITPGLLTPMKLFYPGNGLMVLPHVFSSYVGGYPVFRLENLLPKAGGSLQFDIFMLDGSPPASNNLVENASFELGASTPTAWAATSWQHADLTSSTAAAHSGSRCALIDSAGENDAEWNQGVDGLLEGTSYLLCGFLKGEGIVGYEGKGAGGTVSLSGTFAQKSVGFGTFDWTEACLVIEGPASGSTKIACRLGGYGNTASGRLFCDDFSVRAIDKAF